jgi:hypothetical protein
MVVFDATVAAGAGLPGKEQEWANMAFNKKNAVPATVIECRDSSAGSPSRMRIRIAFVLHAMQVAGAEVLVAETIRRLLGGIAPVIFCLDAVGAIGERLQVEGVDVVCLGRRPCSCRWRCLP